MGVTEALESQVNVLKALSEGIFSESMNPPEEYALKKEPEADTPTQNDTVGVSKHNDALPVRKKRFVNKYLTVDKGFMGSSNRS